MIASGRFAYQFDIKMDISYPPFSTSLCMQTQIGSRSCLPAVGEFSAHILQVGVTHVIDREDKKMVIFFNAFPNVGEQTAGLLLVVFFGGLGLVDDARTL